MTKKDSYEGLSSHTFKIDGRDLVVTRDEARQIGSSLCAFISRSQHPDRARWLAVAGKVGTATIFEDGRVLINGFYLLADSKGLHLEWVPRPTEGQSDTFGLHAPVTRAENGVWVIKAIEHVHHRWAR